MRLLISFAALFASIALVQLGVGVLGPLDALSGKALGFSSFEIGLLGSAHFLGFFVGCVVAPKLIARAGHSRAFAALAAVGVMSCLLHPMIQNAEAWMLLRVGAGFTVAGSYTVVESWLQAKLENSNRARVLSNYRMVDLTGSIASQLMIIQLEPAAYLSYNLIALFAVMSLLPLSMTTAAPPPQPTTPRLRPWRALMVSPLGALGVVVVGLTNSSFRMVGPLYGVEFNLSQETLALFLAAAMLGGALAQPVVGWFADKFDRRRVLIAISVLALGICTPLSLGVFAGDDTALILGSLLFGAAAMPLYSVAAAHANDYCPPDEIVELNAALIFLFAVGAIVSPVVAAQLIEVFGPNALWTYIGAAHVALILFGFFRMTRRASPAKETRKKYRYLPRTSMILGRLFKRQ